MIVNQKNRMKLFTRDCMPCPKISEECHGTDKAWLDDQNPLYQYECQ